MAGARKVCLRRGPLPAETGPGRRRRTYLPTVLAMAPTRTQARVVLLPPRTACPIRPSKMNHWPAAAAWVLLPCLNFRPPWCGTQISTEPWMIRVHGVRRRRLTQHQIGSDGCAPRGRGRRSAGRHCGQRPGNQARRCGVGDGSQHGLVHELLVFPPT